MLHTNPHVKTSFVKHLFILLLFLGYGFRFVLFINAVRNETVKEHTKSETIKLQEKFIHHMI